MTMLMIIHIYCNLPTQVSIFFISSSKNTNYSLPTEPLKNIPLQDCGILAFAPIDYMRLRSPVLFFNWWLISGLNCSHSKSKTWKALYCNFLSLSPCIRIGFHRICNWIQLQLYMVSTDVAHQWLCIWSRMTENLRACCLDCIPLSEAFRLRESELSVTFAVEWAADQCNIGQTKPSGIGRTTKAHAQTHWAP